MLGRSTALLLLALGLAAPATATIHRPYLRLVTQSPLRVRGTYFQPRETVTVALIAPVHRTRRVAVTAAGTFVANLGELPADRCAGLLVRATGSRGDVAVIRGPGPQCPPP